jgi:MFS superfamily sulfate permease-like transporter
VVIFVKQFLKEIKIDKQMKSNYTKIGAGIAIGVAVGVALNNIALGIGIGLVFSAAFIQKEIRFIA